MIEGLHPDAAGWARKGSRLTLKSGERVFLTEQGQGPAVLFLHGFPTWSYDWHRQAAALHRECRCIFFDFPGFGLSDKKRRPYSVFEQADVAEEIAAMSGLERAIVVAHDYGATVAQILLHRQEEGRLSFRIEAGVLLNGGILPGEHRPLLVQKLMADKKMGPFLSRFVTKGTIKRSFRRIFGEEKIDATEMDALWSGIAAQDGQRISHRLLGYMQERRENRPLLEEALTETKVPLRYVWGMDDPISGGHVLDALRRLVPDPDVEALGGVGHYPQIEAPERVSAAIGDMARERRAARA